MQARQWNKYQIQACGSPCTFGDRRHQGVLGGILQVDIGLGSPRLGQRSKSRAVRGVPSKLWDSVRDTEKREVRFEPPNF